MSFYGDSNFYLEVAKGNVFGHSIVNVVGTNPDVDQQEPQDIWGPGGNLVYPTANESVQLVFASNNDTAAGTGAQEITISYLDDTYTEKTPVVVASNGGTIDTGITDYFRIVSMEVTAVGNSGWNEGVVTLEPLGGGNPRGSIGNLGAAADDVGANLSGDGHYTIPAGKTGYLIYAATGVSKDKNAKVALLSTKGDSGIFLFRLSLPVVDGISIFSPTGPGGKFIEKSDIRPVAKSESVNAEVNIIYQIMQIDN